MTADRFSEKRARARRGARMAAVQALYQMELSGADTEAVFADFRDGRLPRNLDTDSTDAAPLGLEQEADGEHFRMLVSLVVSRQARIDRAIARRLVNWKLERIDAVARAILRAGAAELDGCGDIPGAVVINEYVSIASDFFEGPEPAFVNATLDALAKDLRETAV